MWGQITWLESLPVSWVKNTSNAMLASAKMYLPTLLWTVTVIKLIQSESSIFSCLKIHYEPHLITKQSKRSGPAFSAYLIDLSSMFSRSLKNVGLSDFFFLSNCSSYRRIYWFVDWYSLLFQPHFMDDKTEAQKVTYSRPDNCHVHRSSSWVES